MSGAMPACARVGRGSFSGSRMDPVTIDPFAPRLSIAVGVLVAIVRVWDKKMLKIGDRLTGERGVLRVILEVREDHIAVTLGDMAAKDQQIRNPTYR